MHTHAGPKVNMTCFALDPGRSSRPVLVRHLVSDGVVVMLPATGARGGGIPM